MVDKEKDDDEKKEEKETARAQRKQEPHLGCGEKNPKKHFYI